MHRAIRGLALGIATACVCSAAGAVTLNFDSLNDTDVVADQFLASGARFVGDFFVESQTFGGVIVVPSTPNYVVVGGGPPVLLFVDPAKPLRPATTTSVSIVTPQLLAPGCFDGIQLDAYDVAGAFLGTATAQPVGTQGGPQTTTTLTLAGIHEVRFIRIETGCTTPFDDLTYTTVVPADIFSDSFEDVP